MTRPPALPDRQAIADVLAAEIATPAPAPIRQLAGTIAARPGVRAVLFYGAARWRGLEAASGSPVDLYVLTERDSAWNGPGIGALANRLLPPNVYRVVEGGVEAKVAVMRLAAFRSRMRRRSWDTTLWARFSQPVTLVHAADAAARDGVIEALTDAVLTAGWWASRLAPAGAAPLEAWGALYTATYGAELRVEGRSARAGALVAASAERYATLHGHCIAPHGAVSGRGARRGWALRRVTGKLLNLMRLAKAAFTYSGGIEYALAKVERHSGTPVTLPAWQRRWPALAAPLVLWRLWRERRLR